MKGRDRYIGQKFHLFSSDEIMGYYPIWCESCGEEHVLAVRDGKVKVVPNIDEIQH